MSLRALVEGWVGEAIGTLAHRLLLDTHVYHSLNNVILPSAEGTTQLDHVLVSRCGSRGNTLLLLARMML